jgi:hypothetical protein
VDVYPDPLDLAAAQAAYEVAGQASVDADLERALTTASDRPALQRVVDARRRALAAHDDLLRAARRHSVHPDKLARFQELRYELAANLISAEAELVQLTSW